MMKSVFVSLALLCAVGWVSGIAVPENGANDPSNNWTYQQCMDAFGEIKEAHPSNTQESWNKCTSMCQKNWYDSDRPRYVRCYYCCLVKPRPAPVLESVTPSKGYSTLGGDFVIVKGRFFGTEEKTNGEPKVDVTFGEVSAKGCKVESSTKITCETPAGHEGKVAVVVSIDGIKSKPVEAFTYPREFRNCEEIKKAHKKARSGLYKIKPAGGKQIRVYCDMESVGGGWTRCFKQAFSSADNWARSTVGKDISKVTKSSPLPSLGWLNANGCPEIQNGQHSFLIKGYVAGKLNVLVSDKADPKMFVKPTKDCSTSGSTKCLSQKCYYKTKVFKTDNPSSTTATKTTWGAISRSGVNIPRDCKTPGVKSSSSINSLFFHGVIEYSFHTKDHYRRVGPGDDNNGKEPKVVEFYIR